MLGGVDVSVNVKVEVEPGRQVRSVITYPVHSKKRSDLRSPLKAGINRTHEKLKERKLADGARKRFQFSR